MAEVPSKPRSNKKISLLIRSASADSPEPYFVPTETMTKPLKRKPLKKPKERWLLTRKTWRYMTDAGRKLIPDNAQNRMEDIPRIEAYFQEVCKREPRFLLWRKNSYPGALSLRRKQRKLKGGSCRTAASVDEVSEDVLIPERPKDLAIASTSGIASGGRFDIQKMKYDFLNTPVTSSSSPRTFLRDKETFPASYESENTEEQKQLVFMLEQYLTICDEESKPSTSKEQHLSQVNLDYQELIDKLQRHLCFGLSRSNIPSPATSFGQSHIKQRQTVHFDGDHVQKSLSETLNRYFSQSPRRDRVISDLLTNRKALEKLYYDLRKTKSFRGRRDYSSSSSTSTTTSKNFAPWDQTALKHQPGKFERSLADFKKSAPPPLIEIRGESNETIHADIEAQTFPIVDTELQRCEEEYRKQLCEQEEDAKESKYGNRRRSSVDHDDVSQSVSDTIKRYLRMARKKSVDSDKADRFKRVNYDRNLRNIKAKGEITKPGDDDGLHKGCQTNDDWILTYRDFRFDDYNPEINSRASSARSSVDVLESTDLVANKGSPAVSPTSPKSHQSFLSQLLHHKDKSASSVVQGQQVGAAAVGGPQKSKSSSSVMHHGSRLIAKKMFKSRSKSQTRPSQMTCSWTPQGSCIWTSISGKQVILSDTTLLQLSEVERKMLQKVAMAKLQALNLGVNVKVPADSIGAPAAAKPKRRPYLLKRKALTTGIFDAGRKDGDTNKEKDSSSGTGLVFGIPLAQCIENERVARRSSSATMGGSTTSTRSPEEATDINRVSSRSSFTSLIEQSRVSDEKGSCESLISPRDRMIGSVPGLLDSLGCESTGDLPVAIMTVDDEPAVPNIVHTCIRYLETYGLNTLGIFRVSTSKKRIRQLRDDFDCGKDTFVEDEQTPHDVATLLKEYLRDLPDPLLCRDLYQAFVQTQRIRNRKLQQEALQHLIQLLPAANRDTLWTLLNFLSTVGRSAPDQKDASTGEIIQGNKMDSNNLATVFAPNILHCVKPGSAKEVANDKPEDRLDIINVVRTLIDQNKGLFTVPSELLDEVYVHMMDLHPEALNQLLNKRDVNADESLEDLDSESQSNSAPWTPTALTSDINIENALQKLENESANGKPQAEPRRTYSREEFLHETAATGGPNIGMRVRSKDRTRETKKRRDESSTRRRHHHEESNTVSLISRLRGSTSAKNQQDQDPELNTTLSKMRSSSLDSTDSQGELSHQGRVLGNTRDAQRGIITASLTIPVQQQQGLYCNPADIEDIPYIEDAIEPGKQQITIGLVKTATSSGPPSVPPRDRYRRHFINQQIQRQRSMSGESDSSTSIASYMHLSPAQQQPITIGSIILQQQQQQTQVAQASCGYDSAVGSSATYSSPPHYTTLSSVSGSSAQDGGVYSSPPSWASTPPTSPDSQGKAVNYLPEVDRGDDLYSKDKALRRRTSSEHSKTAQDTSLSLVRKLSSSNQKDTSILIKKDSPTSLKKDIPYTPAITSIGNAVLRSRTADFERISKADTRTKTSTTSTISGGTAVQGSSAATKKYTKRRYTDSRHQTRHIPDSETLDNSTQQVYKRKELISSVLSSK